MYILLITICITDLFAFRSLKYRQIKSIKIEYDENAIRLPGYKIPMGVTVVLKDNEVLNTRGFLKGKLLWNNFNITVEGGKFSGGRIVVADHQKFKESQIFVKVESKHHPEKFTWEVINLNYAKSVHIILPETYSKAPGFSVPVCFNVILDSDDTLSTVSQKKKIFGIDNMMINTEGGFFKKGKFYLSPYIEDFPQHKAGINVALNSDPDITDSLIVKLDYKADYNLYISASSGSDGISGSSGLSGFSGCDGGNGGDGSHGNDGEFGHDLSVYADLFFDSIYNSELLRVYVEDLYTDEYYKYLVNPDGGKIKITSGGGSGGDGGSGGSGGNGGSGKDGSFYTVTIQINDSVSVTETKQNPGENGGHGGHGGNGGYGGNGGDGGNISIYLTEDAKPFKYCIVTESHGGSGGSWGFSGSGGSGGTGGSGNPSGASGSGGSSGSMGSSGNSGSSGNVETFSLDENEFPW